MLRVCVFDVNETLLDLGALDPHFQRAFGDEGVRQQWFAQFIQNAFVTTIIERYQPFGAVGAAALDMIAKRRGVTLSPDDRDAILNAIRTLPPHPEVREALERLRSAGVRLASLTNSTSEVATAQLTHAGLVDLFESILSADEVHRLKPAPEPYLYAARVMGVEASQVRLIAAHAWDIAGALHRPGMVLDPLAPQPEIVGSDLNEVVGQILAIEH
jgi:2-haloacid dehalogenase